MLMNRDQGSRTSDHVLSLSQTCPPTWLLIQLLLRSGWLNECSLLGTDMHVCVPNIDALKMIKMSCCKFDYSTIGLNTIISWLIIGIYLIWVINIVMVTLVYGVLSPPITLSSSVDFCLFPVNCCLFLVDFCLFPVEFCLFPVDFCLFPVKVFFFPFPSYIFVFSLRLLPFPCGGVVIRKHNKVSIREKT